MVTFLSEAWKLLLLVALVSVLVTVLRSRATVLRSRAETPSRAELRRLLAAGVLLYLAGAVASLAGRVIAAGIVFAGGLTVCTVALWLSRGGSGSDNSDDDDGFGPTPTPPDDGPTIDWEQFERDLADYCGDSSGDCSGVG